MEMHPIKAFAHSQLILKKIVGTIICEQTKYKITNQCYLPSLIQVQTIKSMCVY